LEQMTREILYIDGMHCHHCVMTVRKLLTMLGAEDVDVEVGVARVTYDPGKVNRSEMTLALSKLGYKLKDEE
jgi:copper chaperone